MAWPLGSTALSEKAPELEYCSTNMWSPSGLRNST